MKRLLISLIAFFGIAWADNYTVTHGTEGLFPEINKAIVSKMYEGTSVSPTFLLVPAARQMMAANEGKADAALFRIKGAEQNFTNLIPVPISHYTVNIHAFSTSGLDAETWEELAPYRISYLSSFLMANRKTEGMNRFEAKTLEQALKLLQAGRVDIVVASRDSGLEIVDSWPDTKITMHSIPLARIPLYHYVHNRHAELIPKLTENLEKLIASGERDAIINEMLPDL